MKKKLYHICFSLLVIGYLLSTPMLEAAVTKNVPQKSRIERLKEAYQTFKEDTRCLFDRKKKCTPEQRQRIIKAAVVLLSVIVIGMSLAVVGVDVYHDVLEQEKLKRQIGVVAARINEIERNLRGAEGRALLSAEEIARLESERAQQESALEELRSALEELKRRLRKRPQGPTGQPPSKRKK